MEGVKGGSMLTPKYMCKEHAGLHGMTQRHIYTGPMSCRIMGKYTVHVAMLNKYTVKKNEYYFTQNFVAAILPLLLV